MRSRDVNSCPNAEEGNHNSCIAAVALPTCNDQRRDSECDGGACEEVLMCAHDHGGVLQKTEDDDKLHSGDGVYRIVVANGCSVSSPGFISGILSSSLKVVREGCPAGVPAGSQVPSRRIGTAAWSVLGLLKSTMYSTGCRQTCSSLNSIYFFPKHATVPEHIEGPSRCGGREKCFTRKKTG